MSTILGYVLILGIVTLIIAATFGTFATLVAGQQDEAVRSTFEVLGHDVASDLESADRLAGRVAGNGSVVLHTRLPDRVGGSTYTIDFEQPSGENHTEITLRSTTHDASVSVRVRTQREIVTPDGGSLQGDRLSITADDDRLVVERA